MLGEMIGVFFAAGRHNCARYMCLYYLRLLNMDITHPGIKQQLEKEGFICEVVIQWMTTSHPMYGWILDIRVTTLEGMSISRSWQIILVLYFVKHCPVHALTRCDYTSSFFRKGKVNPLKKSEKCALHLEGLGRFGEKFTIVDSDNLVDTYVVKFVIE